MHAQTLRKWPLVVTIIALVAVAAGVAMAVGASGGNDAVIHSCVNNNSGVVVIVDHDDTCKNNQTALDWNI